MHRFKKPSVPVLRDEISANMLPLLVKAKRATNTKRRKSFVGISRVTLWRALESLSKRGS
jgi:hypothetical protein